MENKKEEKKSRIPKKIHQRVPYLRYLLLRFQRLQEVQLRLQ